MGPGLLDLSESALVGGGTLIGVRPGPVPGPGLLQTGPQLPVLLGLVAAAVEVVVLVLLLSVGTAGGVVTSASVMCAAVLTTVVMVVAAPATSGLGSLTLDSTGCCCCCCGATDRDGGESLLRFLLTSSPDGSCIGVPFLLGEPLRSEIPRSSGCVWTEGCGACGGGFTG